MHSFGTVTELQREANIPCGKGKINLHLLLNLPTTGVRSTLIGPLVASFYNFFMMESSLWSSIQQFLVFPLGTVLHESAFHDTISVIKVLGQMNLNLRTFEGPFQTDPLVLLHEHFGLKNKTAFIPVSPPSILAQRYFKNCSKASRVL